jgi:hypothetical protein
MEYLPEVQPDLPGGQCQRRHANPIPDLLSRGDVMTYALLPYPRAALHPAAMPPLLDDILPPPPAMVSGIKAKDGETRWAPLTRMPAVLNPEGTRHLTTESPFTMGKAHTMPNT